MKVYLIYFSPGGTGKRTLKNIASGLPKNLEINEIDMCIQANREKTWEFEKDDLVYLSMLTATNLFGQPKEIITSLRGNDTPFVPIVMFGNGYFGNSLKTMDKYMKKQGFRTVAAAAFIGQHSCRPDIATGRPDDKDREIAYYFGKAIYDKVYIEKDLSFNHRIPIDWPNEAAFSTIKCALITLKGGMGNGGIPKKWRGIGVSNEDCIRCGKCIKVCPVRALDLNNRGVEYNIDKCIGCLGCVNNCSEKAIRSTNESMNKMSSAVVKFRHERKEPVIFV